MLQISVITVRRERTCIRSFQDLKAIIEKSLKGAASATDSRIDIKGEEMKIFLGKPISLPSVNKIILAIQEEKSKVKKFNWELKKVGVFEVGHLEMSVS